MSHISLVLLCSMIGYVFVRGHVSVKNNSHATLPLKHDTPPVLFTIPGSGNTWIRQLIDEALHGWSGSVYDDPALRNGGLLGEFHCNKSQTVIKAHPTHFRFESLFVDLHRPKCARSGITVFDSAIVVERAPAATMFAEYERKFGHSHTNRELKENFNRDGFERYINAYIDHEMKRVYTNIYPRVKNELNDVVFITFERLVCKETRNEELRKILSFLTDAPFSDEQLEGIFLHAEKFHRPKGGDTHVDFNFVYTDEFLAYVNKRFGMPTDREEYLKTTRCGGSYTVNYIVSDSIPNSQ